MDLKKVFNVRKALRKKQNNGIELLTELTKEELIELVKILNNDMEIFFTYYKTIFNTNDRK